MPGRPVGRPGKLWTQPFGTLRTCLRIAKRFAATAAGISAGEGASRHHGAVTLVGLGQLAWPPRQPGGLSPAAAGAATGSNLALKINFFHHLR